MISTCVRKEPGNTCIRSPSIGYGSLYLSRPCIRNARSWHSSAVRTSEGQSKDNHQPQIPPSSSPPPEKKRRPIKEIRQRLISSLTPHENIYTVPNFLTFSRLLAAPVVGYLVLHDQYVWALSLFAYAGITDLIDGYIARHWKLQTVVGTVIDPMADKALMTILTVCLALKGALPG